MRPLAARMSVMSGEGALSVFAHAKELERQGHSVIHLELGEPDFHPAAPVKEALKRALDEGKERYCPVLGVPALREAIAAYLKKTRNLDVSSANVVIAPGCKIALFMAMMALVDPGDEVLYPDPGFPGYESMTLGLGGIPMPFVLSERNHLQPDPDEIAAKITPRTKILITNSPGNPTGTVYSDRVQRELPSWPSSMTSTSSPTRSTRASSTARSSSRCSRIPGWRSARSSLMDSRRALQ